MEYSYIPYDTPYQCFPQNQVYHGLPLPDEFNTTEQDFLLGFSGNDASAEPLDLYGNSSLQRYLKDNQRAPLFNPIPQSQLPSAAQPVNAFPPTASHGRQGSPFSSHEPSSCSGGQSPHADTELYTDKTPSTPTDAMLFTPYAAPRSGPYEPECQLPLFGIGEISSAEADQFVTMGDCSNTEGSKTGWEDSGQAIDFETPQRSFTCGIQTTDSTGADNAATQSPVGPGYHRLASPEDPSPVIKEEILIPEHVGHAEKVTSAYPSPSSRSSEEDLEEISLAQSDDDDEDDDDYHPDRKHVVSGAARSNKLKRGAAKKPLVKPAPKRARTASSVQPLKILPPPGGRTQGSHPCPECSHLFKDECTLQSHVKKQHTRPFICVFRFAGCDSTFASKNEWKRHVMSQHLLLYYWLCDIDVCAHTKNDPNAPDSHSGKRNKSRRAEHATGDGLTGPSLPDGAIFNRKDLYTQHLRRMHTPAHIKKTGSAKSSNKAMASSQASSCASPAAWDDTIKTLQTNALRERCQLPEFMECPATHCRQTFNGVDAWDQRMEHVARHLEKAATGAEEPVVFGGPTDPSLMRWVARPDVAVARQVAATGEWVLSNPLRPLGEGRVAVKKKSAAPAAALPVAVAASPAATSVASEMPVEDEDEDAEGEEE
jgi:uncharacterized C2H2 Zn-finger protein